MLDIIRRVILAYKPRPFKVKKRRSPMERLKARMRYRRNRTKYNMARRRTYRKNKVFNKTRKIHKRAKPSWLGKLFGHKPKKRHPNKPHGFLHHLIKPHHVKQIGVRPHRKAKPYKIHVPHRAKHG